MFHSCVSLVTFPPQQADPRPQVLRGEWQYVRPPRHTQEGHEVPPVRLQVHHPFPATLCRVSLQISFVSYHQCFHDYIKTCFLASMVINYAQNFIERKLKWEAGDGKNIKVIIL